MATVDMKPISGHDGMANLCKPNKAYDLQVRYNNISYPPCKKGIRPGICEKPAGEFIISSPLLNLNFNNDNKEIGEKKSI